jgi:hypothetical protein
VQLKIPVSPAAAVGGLIAAACLVAGVLYVQRGAHMDLQGKVLKVRTLATDETSSIAAIDFRFLNTANYPFVVREVAVTIVDKNGATVESSPVSEVDARRLFEYYPALGQKYNDSLVLRDKIPGGAKMDRMIVARFEVPEATLTSRKNLTVRIVDVDGPEAVIQEIPK